MPFSPGLVGPARSLTSKGSSANTSSLRRARNAFLALQPPLGDAQPRPGRLGVDLLVAGPGLAGAVVADDDVDRSPVGEALQLVGDAHEQALEVGRRVERADEQDVVGPVVVAAGRARRGGPRSSATPGAGAPAAARGTAGPRPGACRWPPPSPGSRGRPGGRWRRARRPGRRGPRPAGRAGTTGPGRRPPGGRGDRAGAPPSPARSARAPTRAAMKAWASTTPASLPSASSWATKERMAPRLRRRTEPSGRAPPGRRGSRRRTGAGRAPPASAASGAGPAGDQSIGASMASRLRATMSRVHSDRGKTHG